MKRPTGGVPLVLLVLLLGLAACGGDTAPSATPQPTYTGAPVAKDPAAPAPATATAAPAPATATPGPAATATDVPATDTPLPLATDTPLPPAADTAAPTPTIPAASGGGPSGTTPGLPGIPPALPGANFVVPAAPATPVPGVIAVAVVANATNQQPDLPAELQAYWTLFYGARTLAPGGRFDVAATTNLTAPPYRDYTIPLLQKSQAEADAGKLQQVAYSGISVLSVTPRSPAAGGKPDFDVQISRTQSQVRTDSKPAPQTLTLQFRLTRTDLGDGQVAWQAYDFLSPSTGAWLSASLTAQIAPAQVGREVTHFFVRFYAARSLASGVRFDLDTTAGLTAGAYQDYTLPLLKGQQADADAGKVQAVSYSAIAVNVLNWDPLASSHGGLATVAVTRTSHVRRPGQPEEVQTATYQFRVHRHQNDDGTPFWLAVDFLSPITNKWVSESAGMSGPIPPAGHG